MDHEPSPNRPSDLRDLAKALSTLSLEMLDLARKEDWEQVQQLEEQRRQLMTRLFAEPLLPAAAFDVGNCIQEILTCNSKIVDLIQRRKNLAAEQVKTVRQGRKISQVYNSVRA